MFIFIHNYQYLLNLKLYQMDRTFPFLTHENFLLRKIIANDIAKIYEGLSNPEIIKHYGVSYDSLSATTTQMDWFNLLKETNTGIWWAIVNIENTVFYGAIGLNNLSYVHKKAEIGYWLLPEYWGQKLMKNAIPLVCNYAFDVLKIHRIEALVESENNNSKKLLEKLNFNFEGRLIDYEIKNGNYISLDSYAKFN